MEFELEVIGLDTGILTFQFLHRLYYLVNSYNCYHRAYSVKYCPNFVVPFPDWITSMVKPFLKLHYVLISRECGQHNALAGDHD